MTRPADIPAEVHEAAMARAKAEAVAYYPRLRWEDWMATNPPLGPGGRPTRPPADYAGREKWLAQSLGRWNYQWTVRQWRKSAGS